MAKAAVLKYTDEPTNREQDNYITKLPCKKMPNPLKNHILDYMFNKPFVQVVGPPDKVMSPFTGKQMDTHERTFADDKYYWTDRLPLYVRDHDIALPQEFIDHVKEFYAKGGTAEPCYDWEHPSFFVETGKVLDLE